MAAPYSFVKRKCEDALEELFIQRGGSELNTLTIFKGFSGMQKTVPRMEIVFDRAQPEIEANLPSGNFTVSDGVMVTTSYKHDVTNTKHNTARQFHSSIVGIVEDLWLCHPYALLQMFKALPIRDFSVQWFTPGAMEDDSDGRLHQSVLKAEIYCCPSVVDLPAEVLAYEEAS